MSRRRTGVGIGLAMLAAPLHAGPRVTMADGAAEVMASNVAVSRDRYMAGLLLWSRGRTAASGQAIYAYRYDHAYPPVRGGRAFGAFHSSELPYIFGTIGLGDRAFGPVDLRIARQWQDHLLAFLRDGDPSLPHARWRPVLPHGTTVMVMSDRPGPAPAVSTPERLAAWADYARAGGTLGLM